MEEYVDPYCPFCRTEGRVTVYASRTSAFDTLYRCGLCYKVFDQKDRELQEVKNRQRRIKKEEILPVLRQKPRKKKMKLVAGGLLFAMILTIYHFFS